MIFNIQQVVKIHQQHNIQHHIFLNQVILCLNIFKNYFYIEKRKYSKYNEIDNQHKSILVPSIGCKKNSFIFLTFISYILFPSW
jgi:hypothetical protein